MSKSAYLMKPEVQLSANEMVEDHKNQNMDRHYKLHTLKKVSSRCLGFQAKTVCQGTFIMKGLFKGLFSEITSVRRMIPQFLNYSNVATKTPDMQDRYMPRYSLPTKGNSVQSDNCNFPNSVSERSWCFSVYIYIVGHFITLNICLITSPLWMVIGRRSLLVLRPSTALYRPLLKHCKLSD